MYVPTIQDTVLCVLEESPFWGTVYSNATLTNISLNIKTPPSLHGGTVPAIINCKIFTTVVIDNAGKLLHLFLK